MDGLRIENTSEKLILSIDKENFSESVLLKIMKVAHIEYLIGKAGFTDEVLSLDEEIKEAWWQENKIDLLRRVGK